jgi:broad specificity phosphatase PhoE
LARARDTAGFIADSVEVDERWIELDYGVYDGRPLADLGAAQWSRWRSDPSFAPEGGESLLTLAGRVYGALDELARDGSGDAIVVVSHVSPIKAAVAWALGVGIEISWRCLIDQASITTVRLGERGPSLVTFNDSSHLSSHLD